MAISEDEWEKLTDNVHPLDIRDQLDNATEQNLSSALSDLYDLSKKVIDHEYCEFNDNTNDLLVELVESANDIQDGVQGIMEKLESINNMLSKIIEAVPESVFEE